MLRSVITVPINSHLTHWVSKPAVLTLTFRNEGLCTEWGHLAFPSCCLWPWASICRSTWRGRNAHLPTPAGTRSRPVRENIGCSLKKTSHYAGKENMNRWLGVTSRQSKVKAGWLWCGEGTANFLQSFLGIAGWFWWWPTVQYLVIICYTGEENSIYIVTL